MGYSAGPSYGQPDAPMVLRVWRAAHQFGVEQPSGGDHRSQVGNEPADILRGHHSRVVVHHVTISAGGSGECHG